MKKTLSLLLVLAMVLSSFGFAFAAEDEIVPAEFLNEKGILKGNAEGNLMLEDNLKRQDMVVMLSRLLGVEEEAKAYEGETTFTDIADPFYVPYIAWAEAEELTEGVGDNKFGFDRAVKENEVVAFLLRALGYTDVAWEDVPAKAVELGLVEKDADLTVDAKREVLANLTYKALGMKMKDSEKTLAEHLEIEMPVPEKLEVEVNADNLKEIKVVFNKAVDEGVVTNLDNYETDAGDIEDIVYVEDENMVIFVLKDAMDNKEDYEISIKVEELDVTKEFTAYDNTVPAVEDVVALGTKAVKVIMSEPIKKANISDFKLDGKTIYGTTEIVGREIVIKPYKTLEAKEYELTIERLEDYAEFKSVETKRTFEVVEDKEKPVVEEVSAYLESAVITFSEDIDNSTVSRYNVYHGAKVYPEDAVKIAGNKVYIEFDPDKALPVYETTLHITGFADYSGNKMDAAEIKVKPSIDESRPEVLKVELEKDRKTITVKFNKSVYEKDAIDIDSYSILDSKDNKQTISEINKLDSKNYEIILGKALSENKEYRLKISGIRDNNKYPNVMLAYDQPLTVGDYTLPKVDYVSGTWDLNKYAKDEKIESTIHVFFTKEMDLGTISNPENYLVKVGNANKLLSDVGGDVDVIKSDGTVVLLTVVNKDKVTEVGVLGVKDTTGKKLSNFGEMQPVQPKAFALNSAEAEEKDEIVLEFSIPVARADRNAFKVNGSYIVKEVNIDGAEVTLVLEGKKLNADVNQVEVLDEQVVSYNGDKLGEITITVDDKIAPSISKVTPVYKAGDANVLVEVLFDEEIKIDSEATAKTDLVVKRITEEAEVNFTVVKPEAKNQLNIVIPVEEFKVKGEFVDSTIEISIVEDARFITDVPGNAANAMSKRTIKVTGVEDEVVAPATYAVTFVVKAGETVVNDATIVVKKGETVVEPVEGAYKLEAGDYTYTVTKDGYKTVTESFTVESAAKEVSVTLAAESKNKIEVKAKETATGIGRILTVEKTGYEEAVKYLLKNAEGTALNKGGLPADFSVETIVVFEKEGDTVTVELYDVEGNILETLPVVITK